MWKSLGLSIALGCAMGVAGCANLTHFNTSRGAWNGHTTYFVDAKQRVVSTSKTADAEDGRAVYAVCAEPSPDALSALAASQGFSLNTAEVESALTNSLAEGAGSIGLRTQSIQLMRDSMYRLCEAHLSGFIGDLAFETLHRRFQSSMVAILAIEQLTSVARPPGITLGGVSGANAIQVAAMATEHADKTKADLEGARKQIETANAELAKATGERDAAKTAAEKLKKPEGEEETAEETKARSEAETKVSTAEQTVKAKQKAVDDARAREAELAELHRYFESAKRAAMSGSTSEFRISVEQGLGAPRPSNGNVDKLARSVSEIVSNTLNLSFSDELCTTVLVAAADGQLNRSRNDTGPRLTSGDQTGQQISGLYDQLAQVEKQIGLIYEQQDRLNADIKSREVSGDTSSVEYRKLQEDLSKSKTEIDVLDVREEGIYRQIDILDSRNSAATNDVIRSCRQVLDQRALQQQRWEESKVNLLSKATAAEAPGLLRALADYERGLKWQDGGFVNPSPVDIAPSLPPPADVREASLVQPPKSQ